MQSLYYSTTRFVVVSGVKSVLAKAENNLLLLLNQFVRYSLLLLIWFLWCQPVRGQFIESVNLGSRYTIKSEQLGEDRQYLVSLPQSYQQDDFYQNKRYPVLILLDADNNFRFASTMIGFMSAAETEQIPEMITVAVVNTNRTRDMTTGLGGQSNPFLAFLERELLPQIDRQYRTLPYRVLVGHSLAGLFALNCFLEQRAFHAYITIDPTITWDQSGILKKAGPILRSNHSFTTKLFVAQANNPFETGQHTGLRGKAFDTFQASLAGNHSRKFTYTHAFYGQEDHYSVPLPSLRDGLLFVFKGYKFPVDTFLSQGSTGIVEHYNRFVNQLGTSLAPPGKVINQMGQFLLASQAQLTKAQDLLTLNQTYYPASAIVYSSLGDVYKAKKDTARAIQYYQKSLSLQAANPKAKQELTGLAKP